MKRTLSLLVVLLLALTALPMGMAESAEPYWDMLGEVSDTSELPDWEGKKLTLRVWNTHGLGGTALSYSDADDVVVKEIERVTGVRFDWVNSFDNNGVTYDAKLPLLVAAGDYPDLVFVSYPQVMFDLVEGGVLWNLTEYYPEYCGMIADYVPVDEFPAFYGPCQVGDQMYMLPVESGTADILFPGGNDAITGYDAERYITNCSNPQGATGFTCVWVRDDIYTALYPEAMTWDEIVAAYYDQEGSFTAEQILDNDLTNAEDYFAFLRTVEAYADEHGVTDINGVPVETTYGPYSGTDNWSWLNWLPMAVDGTMESANYFAYWSIPDKKYVRTLDQDWCKEFCRQLNLLQRENILSQESLIDTKAIFDEKVASGRYAVLYGGYTNPNDALKAAGADFRYRPVYVNRTYHSDTQCTFDSARQARGLGVLNKGVIDTEEKLIQYLHCYNYMMSAVGAKLVSWGPASAGLFESNEEGYLRYTDPELEANMVYRVDNGMNLKYTLFNDGVPQQAALWATVAYGLWASVYSPAYQYDYELKDSRVASMYAAATIDGHKRNDYAVVIATNPDIYNYTSTIEGISTFWTARQGFEQQIIKAIASADDAQFEAQYQQAIDYADMNGLTEETLAEFTQMFVEGNGDYLRAAGLID